VPSRDVISIPGMLGTSLYSSISRAPRIVIMVGDGNADPQGTRPRGNGLYGIAAIRVSCMKMHIKTAWRLRKTQDQVSQILFF